MLCYQSGLFVSPWSHLIVPYDNIFCAHSENQLEMKQISPCKVTYTRMCLFHILQIFPQRREISLLQVFLELSSHPSEDIPQLSTLTTRTLWLMPVSFAQLMDWHFINSCWRKWVCDLNFLANNVCHIYIYV